MAASIVYGDRWGEIIDRPDTDVIEIRWFDTTSEMTAGEFNRWFAQFAGEVERAGRTKVLVDSTRFRMPMDRMDAAWRDANIIPRYNAAGVNGFAFLMPDTMPAIGAPPIVDGPAQFPTAYFGIREAALTWLATRS